MRTLREMEPVQAVYPISVNYQEYWKRKQQFLKTAVNVPLWLMFAVEDGRFSYEIDNVAGVAAAGDVVVCPPLMDFRREVIAPLSFYYFVFRYEDGTEMETDRTIELLRLLAFKFTSSERERLYSNFRQLNRLVRAQDGQSKSRIQHFANDIWLMLHMEAESLALRGKLAEDRLMKEAKALIDRHAFREVRLQDIAAHLHIHPVQLSRRFQHIFGVTPSRYLTSIRMEKAKSLLVQSEYTIDHIARLCGYENGFYFSRAFTGYCKMNPSQYRKLYGLASL
ncbi:helix-turn-helix transcriptional regulator [Paenibacillus sp. GYB003]|uniref:helix-turn-helix transcriptional regulator n=1 Tax=Paenibacillus sp. GYB003 TaxID=2994392 RepID=UPI002F968881